MKPFFFLTLQPHKRLMFPAIFDFTASSMIDVTSTFQLWFIASATSDISSSWKCGCRSSSNAGRFNRPTSLLKMLAHHETLWLGVFKFWLCSYIMIIFPNLNSLLALPTLIATLASSACKEGGGEVVVQDRSSNLGLYHDKGPQKKLFKHPPKPS
jgi:hypothetical protein